MLAFKEWLLTETDNKKLPKGYRVTVAPTAMADGTSKAYVARIWLNYQYVGSTVQPQWYKDDARLDGIAWAWDHFKTNQANSDINPPI